MKDFNEKVADAYLEMVTPEDDKLDVFIKGATFGLGLLNPMVADALRLEDKPKKKKWWR